MWELDACALAAGGRPSPGMHALLPRVPTCLAELAAGQRRIDVVDDGQVRVGELGVRLLGACACRC